MTRYLEVALEELGGQEGLEGVVVRLDRGFPLVECSTGALVRCEHATSLVKGALVRMVVGDRVAVTLPDGHDRGIIEEIFPRRTAFVRRDPAERTAAQVLAANFDLVMVVEPVAALNQQRLERELVLAHDTGAGVAVVLTKADLVTRTEAATIAREAGELAGRDVPVLTVSANDPDSVERIRKLVPAGSTAILIGKSGAGKSTLVNSLAGDEIQDTGVVRAYDGKGRHTTVGRVMVKLPDGGRIVDMPGIRGLGMWDVDAGLGMAFSDVEEIASRCRFRDCSHGEEPGCAVRAAIETGELPAARVESYRSLAAEIETVRMRREEARHLHGEKASDRKKGRRKRP